MTQVNYAELYAKSIEESGAGAEVFPDSDYVVEIASVKRGTSKGKSKPQVGIRLKVLQGAFAGKSTWVNQTFTADNPQAVAVFIRIMRSLGVPQEAINAGVPPDALADYIVVGSVGTATLGHHVWNNEPRQDLKGFSLQEAGAVVPQAPVQATFVPQPAPAPIPQQEQQFVPPVQYAEPTAGPAVRTPRF